MESTQEHLTLEDQANWFEEHSQCMYKEGDYSYLVSKEWVEQFEKALQNNINEKIPVDNSKLVDNNGELIPFNYDDDDESRVETISVPKEVWDKIITWHGGGPEIMRKTVKYNDNIVAIEQYLWIKAIQGDKEKIVETHSYEKVQDLKEKIIKLLELNNTVESRLIDSCYGSNEKLSFLKVLDDDNYLEEYNFRNIKTII